MIRVVPTPELLSIDRDWWQARAHARMSEVSPGDPGYLEWGPLRLCSLDRIAAGGAFDMHCHEDIEIVTIVLEGVFGHRDSAGGVGTQSAPCVATTSAGSGIEHCEAASDAGPVRVVQIWLEPRTKQRPPVWQSRQAPWTNDLTCLASGSDPGALPIDVDADVFGCSMAEGSIVERRVLASRHGYLLTCSGELDVSGHGVQAGERALVDGPEDLTIRAVQPAEIVLLDLP